jgi:UDP-N-acetylglucosamine 1-carboxyvinyltransferase
MEDLIISRSSLNSQTTIDVGGFKHVMVSIIAASIVKNLDVTLTNVPNIYDTHQIVRILKKAGKKISYTNGVLSIQKGKINNSIIDNDLSSTIHGSIYMFVAIVLNSKQGEMKSSGGCAIGNESNASTRPEKNFLEVLEKFGVTIRLTRDGTKRASYEKLKAVDIDIADFSDANLFSGATKVAVLCSLALSDGIVRILHPYLKPDVTELLHFMELIGYKIEKTKESLVIYCRKSSKQKVKFELMPDLIEIISFISFSIFNEIDIRLKFKQIEKVKKGLMAEFKYLDQIGGKVKWQEDGINILSHENLSLNSFSITVNKESIFSDSQSFFALLGLKSSNSCKIIEEVWTSRFSYAKQLGEFGIPFKIKNNAVYIEPLANYIEITQDLRANDLRTAFTLLIYVIKTKQAVVIKDFHHIHRGYENIYQKLSDLGIIFSFKDLKVKELDLNYAGICPEFNI